MNSRYQEQDGMPHFGVILQILSLLGRTEIQSLAKLSLTHLNVLTLGGERASDLRLSGLASTLKRAHAVSKGMECPPAGQI